MVDFLHVKPGKGSAFVRSKLKNLETGSTLEKTWRAGEAFGDAQVDKEEMKYSYLDGEDMVFMSMETFEEVSATGPGAAELAFRTTRAVAEEVERGR